MAIIDPKRREALEEAERNARAQAEEYARRYDSSSSSASADIASSRSDAVSAEDSSGAAPARHQSGSRAVDDHSWMQPPPAYEDTRANAARQGHESARSNPQDHWVSEESPLLPTAGDRGSKRNRLPHSLQRRSSKCAVLLVIALLVIILTTTFRDDRHERGELSPLPPDGDGDMDQPPSWSDPVELKPGHWSSPGVPLYSSTAWFTLPANDDFTYLHATGQGASGAVILILAENLSPSEWKRRSGNKKDQIPISVEARYTDVNLRNRAFVGRVTKGERRHGLSIHSERQGNEPPNTFLEFIVHVYLPQPEQRSRHGLAEDGSSLLKSFEVTLSNMRMSFDMYGFEPSTGVTFGAFTSRQGNGGLDLHGYLRSLSIIDITLSNGHVRDIGTPEWEMHAPEIFIKSYNGAISLPLLFATKLITIDTENGAINITDRAVAPKIKVATVTGVLYGSYKPLKELKVNSEAGEVDIRVDLGHDETSHDGQYEICTVEVRCETGKVMVQYANQTPAVRLVSDVSGSLGSVTVKHDAGFEGFFDLASDIGALHVDHAASGGEQKHFIIDEDQRNGFENKHVAGRTYFYRHEWPSQGETPSFALSESRVSSDIGTLRALFR